MQAWSSSFYWRGPEAQRHKDICPRWLSKSCPSQSEHKTHLFHFATALEPAEHGSAPHWQYAPWGQEQGLLHLLITSRAHAVLKNTYWEDPRGRSFHLILSFYRWTNWGSGDRKHSAGSHSKLALALGSVQFSPSVPQTLCNPMDCSTPVLPVHHQLPEFTQTHVHWVGDAIQQSNPLSSPSPHTFNLSQQ